MAVTYNSWITPQYILRDEGGTFSGNLTGQAAFDYFRDNCQANDALYFGNVPRFDDIQVYVGTAFAAQSVSFAWEYYSGLTASWQPLTVQDGTNGFTTLGQQTIAFVPPDDWIYTTVNGQQRYWVRCRIASVTSPTEGGANSTQAAQVGNNLIVVTGTGNNFATLNAAVGNLCEIFLNFQVRLRARLQVGDGTTVSDFVETQKQVWSPCFALSGSYDFPNVTFAVKNNATLRFGEVADLATKRGKNGCAFISGVEAYRDYCYLWMEANGYLEIYGSAFLRNTILGRYIYNAKIWDTVLNRGIWGIRNSDLSRLTFCNEIGPALYDLQNTTIYDLASYGAYGIWYPSTARNCKFKGTLGYVYRQTGGGPAYLIDCESNTWEVYWHPVAENPQPVYRQYSLNLRVSDSQDNPISGASVKVYDRFGTLVADTATGSDGRIAEQVLTHEKRERDPNSNPTGYTTVSILTTYSPYRLVITKAGYQTYDDKLTLDRKMDLEVALGPTSSTARPISVTEHYHAVC